MPKRLSALFSTVPPKSDYDPVRKAIEQSADKPQVASALRQFSSMPPSTMVLANPVRYKHSVKCPGAQLDLNIRSFALRGCLHEEDIVTGTADAIRVMCVGLFGCSVQDADCRLFAGFLRDCFAAAVENIDDTVRLLRKFPKCPPDVAMQHTASLRKAVGSDKPRGKGAIGINPRREANDILDEMIRVHMANVAAAVCSSYLRYLFADKPGTTDAAAGKALQKFIESTETDDPFQIGFSLLLRRPVSATEARILSRLGAIQVHHGSAGSNMVARYLATLHTRSVSDFFTASQMALDSARHFGAISDMTDFINELERAPRKDRDDRIRERIQRGSLPTFGHPEIHAAGRENRLEMDPRPALYVAPLFDALDSGEIVLDKNRKARLALAERLYQIALIEGVAKTGGSGKLRLTPNTDFGAWIVQEALGFEEPDRTLLSYMYRGFGWMMDAREQLQQPIIRPVIAPDPSVIPAPSDGGVIPDIITRFHDRLAKGKAMERQGKWGD